jgi:hypothetical protein
MIIAANSFIWFGRIDLSIKHRTKPPGRGAAEPSYYFTINTGHLA